MAQFGEALHRFGAARRASTEHVFEGARVRHEPERLNNSSIWGGGVVPYNLGKEVRDNAAKTDKSLVAKWDMSKAKASRKRKFKGQGDPLPKTKKSFRDTSSPAYYPHYEESSSSSQGRG